MTKMGRPIKPYDKSFVARVHVSLLPATKDEMRIIADETGRSLSDICREAVRLYLKTRGDA